MSAKDGVVYYNICSIQYLLYFTYEHWHVQYISVVTDTIACGAVAR